MPNPRRQAARRSGRARSRRPRGCSLGWWPWPSWRSSGPTLPDLAAAHRTAAKNRPTHKVQARRGEGGLSVDADVGGGAAARLSEPAERVVAEAYNTVVLRLFYGCFWVIEARGPIVVRKPFKVSAAAPRPRKRGRFRVAISDLRLFYGCSYMFHLSGEIGPTQSCRQYLEPEIQCENYSVLHNVRVWVRGRPSSVSTVR